MRIFYDIDTQHDFMDKDGSLYVPDAELIKPNLAKLTQYAKHNRIPIVGSVDAHAEDDSEFQLFPPHCVKDTSGARKIPQTGLYGFYRDPNSVGYGGSMNIADESIYLINLPYTNENKEKFKDTLKFALDRITNKEKNNAGLFFEKQHYDVFTNPVFNQFLEFAKVKQAVVYGVATDYCVRAAVLGMQEQGVQCYVVEDAIKPVNINFKGKLDPEFGKKALEEMTEAGAQFVTTKDVLGGGV